jgi:hypothetical protein
LWRAVIEGDKVAASLLHQRLKARKWSGEDNDKVFIKVSGF